MGVLFAREDVPGSSVPRVPLEVWTTILRNATLDRCSFPASYLQAPPLTSSTRKAYGDTMATKRSLSLVCRAWSALTVPFLFEHVKLIHTRTLYALLRSITDSMGFRHGKMVTHGDFVRRLDITLCDLNSEVLGVDILSKLQYLFRNLPNLRILLFKDLRCFIRPCCNMNSRRNWRFFLETVSPSLEVISWTDGASVSASLWKTFLQSHPNLRAVLLPCCEPFAGSGHLRLRLSRLEEVVCCARRDLIFYPGAFSSTDLPRLKSLTHLLPYNRDYRPSYHGHDPFFLTHGAKLKSVHFWSFNRVGEFPLGKYWDTVRETCPEIREVGLCCYWNELVDFPYLPSVRTLAVRHLNPQMGRHDCKMMLGSLENAKQKGLVGLRYIRFLDERNLIHIKCCFRTQLIFALENLAKLGVTVEGCDGLLLTKTISYIGEALSPLPHPLEYSMTTVCPKEIPPEEFAFSPSHLGWTISGGASCDVQ